MTGLQSCVITPLMSRSICLRIVGGIASNLQDFEHMSYTTLDTSASVMGLNYWKESDI